MLRSLPSLAALCCKSLTNALCRYAGRTNCWPPAVFNMQANRILTQTLSWLPAQVLDQTGRAAGAPAFCSTSLATDL